MHGTYIKIAETQQTKLQNIYNSTKLKLLETNAAIWYSKICRDKLRQLQRCTTVELPADDTWKSDYNINVVRIKVYTRVGTLIVATIYLQLIQNRYMFRSFTVLQCSHQHCVQPVASDVEVVVYL